MTRESTSTAKSTVLFVLFNTVQGSREMFVVYIRTIFKISFVTLEIKINLNYSKFVNILKSLDKTERKFINVMFWLY